MATRKAYTRPPPHSLFRDSFERHRHLIGPMLDEDEQALAALTSSEDAFRATLYTRFCHDDTRYSVYQRYQDARDLQPIFDHPIHVVAREHPEWIGKLLLDAEVAATEPGQAMRETLFSTIMRAFLPDEIQLEHMRPEERTLATRDRPLPDPLPAYCLSVVKGEYPGDDEWRYDAMELLTQYGPVPPGGLEILGQCIVSEPVRQVKEMLILFMDSDEAARHMDPVLVPQLRKIRTRLRRTMDPAAGEALDRIITRLGGKPPVARPSRQKPRPAPPLPEMPTPDPLFRDSFERHRHHIQPMLDGDREALEALSSSEDALRASLYPCFCNDDTLYNINGELTLWHGDITAFNRPLFKVLREHPEWVESLLDDPILDESEVGESLRMTVNIYATMHPVMGPQ